LRMANDLSPCIEAQRSWTRPWRVALREVPDEDSRR
jgi:hypothetical protein